MSMKPSFSVLMISQKHKTRPFIMIIKKIYCDGMSSTNVPSSWTQSIRRNRNFKRRCKPECQPSNTVVNISSHQLTKDETSLLSTSLNFCPDPGLVNEPILTDELDNFERSLKSKEYFGLKESEKENESDLENETIIGLGRKNSESLK